MAIPGAKQQALLASLALNLGQAPSRNKLINLLWGTRFDDQARQSLRQAISKLRKSLNSDEAKVLWSNADQVGLDVGLVAIDTVDFERLSTQADFESLRAASELFSGALLDDLHSSEEEFDEWIMAERTRLNEIACGVFDRLAEHFVKSGDTQAAIETAKRLIALDPLREPSHRQLMRILAQCGQRASAIRQYNSCRELLKSELEVEPEPETQRLLQEIRAVAPVSAKDQPQEAAPVFGSDSGSSSDPGPETQSPFFGAPSATSRPTIAILPFASLGNRDEDNFMGQAMSEDLTTALSKYRWLSVTALNSRSGSDDLAQDLQLAATELGAEYAVEGSLRQGSSRLRLTVHLIDLKSRKYLWVQQYDREIDDLLNLQDALVEIIAATVESELTSVEGERARHIDNQNMTAWDCYHLGLSTQYEFGKESNAAAQDLFRRAIKMDPNFGAAYARLSYALVISTIYFEADQTSGLLDEALELARKATRIDDQDAIAQFALGRVHLARGEYERSLVALETATKLNPTMAQAFCGLGDSLAYAGRLKESVSQFEEAVRLSPNDPYRWAFLMYGAIAHLFMKEFEKAADWGGQATRVPNSHYWANAVQVAALGHLGRDDEAEKAKHELLRLNPNFTCSFAEERLFYLRIDEQRELYIDGLKKAGVPV